MQSLRRKLPSANALFTFEAAARCGNFTHAARELYVTQPAVSRMLSRMEDHLGVKLFDRDAGKITLTENGRILYLRVSEAFHGIDAALQEIEQRDTGKEPVTLSVSTAFTTHWLMPRMNKLRESFPDIDLRYQLIQASLSGPVEDVDIGMRFLDGRHPDTHAMVMTPEILVPLSSPSYRQGILASKTEHKEIRHTLINLSQSHVDWFEQFADHCDPALSAVANTLSFPDYAVVLQAALLGQGVAMGWVNVASHWLKTGMLVPAQKRAFPTGRICHLIYPQNRPIRQAAVDICEWIIRETRTDMENIDAMYPKLGIAELMNSP